MSSIMRWRSGETASVVSSLMVVLLLVGRGTSPRRQHTKHNLSVKTPGSSPCLDAGSQPYRGSGLVPRPSPDIRLHGLPAEKRTPTEDASFEPQMPFKSLRFCLQRRPFSTPSPIYCVTDLFEAGFSTSTRYTNARKAT